MHSHSEKAAASGVKRRKVFYIPGYDPIHPRRYRELYRIESKDQGQTSGYDIELSAKYEGARYGWHVKADIDGHVTESDFEVLVWSDIVRDSMSNTIAVTYAHSIAQLTMTISKLLVALYLSQSGSKDVHRQSHGSSGLCQSSQRPPHE